MPFIDVFFKTEWLIWIWVFYSINSDIIFTNGRIIQGPECADHALALLLSLTRNIVRTLKADYDSRLPRPIELLNKKAVIIGVGGIGMCIAERLSAFGIDVTGVDDNYVPMLSFLKNKFMLLGATVYRGFTFFEIKILKITKVPWTRVLKSGF